MRQPRVRRFSPEEHAQRISNVRRYMEQRELYVLLVHSPENIFYLTGYQTPGYYWHQVLILPLASEPVFIPPPHEASLIDEYCLIEDVRLFPDTSDWAQVTAEALGGMGLGSARIGIEAESWFLTVDLRDRLAGQLPDATMINCSGLIESCRLIKSPLEFEYLREAAAMSEQGMRVGIASVRAGAQEQEVAAAVQAALDLVGSEYTGLPPFITSGCRSELVHATWSTRRIESGELVFLEIPGSANRYHAAHSRSVFVGEPPDIVRQADEVSKSALATAKDKMLPGVPASEVFDSARAVIDDAKLGYKQGRRIAYGIGIAFPPGWDEGQIFSINSDEPRPLQAGMSFHVITTMRLPGVGAIGCSDTVLINDCGAETLTSVVPPGVQYLN